MQYPWKNQRLLWAVLDFVFIPLIFPSSKLKTKIIDQVNPELKDLFVLLVDVWVNGQDSIWNKNYHNKRVKEDPTNIGQE